MSDVSWTQLSMLGLDPVTEVIIKVGMVGSYHGQWQVEARDETGALVSMGSGWSFDLASLDDIGRRLHGALIDLRDSRHAPF